MRLRKAFRRKRPFVDWANCVSTSSQDPSARSRPSFPPMAVRSCAANKRTESCWKHPLRPAMLPGASPVPQAHPAPSTASQRITSPRSNGSMSGQREFRASGSSTGTASMQRREGPSRKKRTTACSLRRTVITANMLPCFNVCFGVAAVDWEALGPPPASTASCGEAFAFSRRRLAASALLFFRVASPAFAACLSCEPSPAGSLSPVAGGRAWPSTAASPPSVLRPCATTCGDPAAAASSPAALAGGLWHLSAFDEGAPPTALVTPSPGPPPPERSTGAPPASS
mmetsp:Transcript_92903/g.262361  ORF Transcript_92903/g.262361 Transcript_92903/m.262361 type:complete len:284 (-) Transcript_92903:1143-1994(-)